MHGGAANRCVRRAKCVVLAAVLLILLLSPTLTIAQVPEVQLEPPPEIEISQIPVALSEVCPLPADPSDPSWVEIYNFGPQPLDMAAWCISDANGNVFAFPRDLAPVPPQGIVLVTFAGPTSPAQDDKVFEPDNVARLWCREPAAPTYFRGKIGECALWSSTAQAEGQLADYVCWGAVPSSAAVEQASRVGLWPDPAVWFIATDPLTGAYVLPQDGTIGRPVFGKPPLWEPPAEAATRPPNEREQRLRVLGCNRLPTPAFEWDVYPPHAVSPGSINPWPPPFASAPRGGFGCSDSSKPVRFIWRPRRLHGWGRSHYGMRWRAHIQVGSQADMESPFIDTYTQGRHEASIAPGTYYWRCRLEAGNVVTLWSKTTQFTLPPPTAGEP